MTSGLDGLGAAALPNLTTLPSVANAPALGSAKSKQAPRTGGGSFDHLLKLQDRGRKLETELQSRASKVASGDPAATAQAQQAAFYAKELKEIRELVGPAPGGNARRALAAIVTRLEGGGELKPTDKARIRLAIAADEKRVDLAGATRIRDVVLGLDAASEAIAKQASDPTLVQDPARVAIFKQQNRQQQDMRDSLVQLLGGTGPVDVRAATRVVEDRLARS